jgi:hypothetical protein
LKVFDGARKDMGFDRDRARLGRSSHSLIIDRVETSTNKNRLGDEPALPGIRSNASSTLFFLPTFFAD